MPVAVQPSFTGGEWSPSLYSRVDLQKYATAARTMRNWFCHPHGGVSNRAGTKFIAKVKDSTKAVRLIPFRFSVLQSYALEFGDQYMRVLKDGAQVIYDPGNATDIVKAATYKWTASGAGTNEYYVELLAGGDPSLDEPSAVYEDVGGADTVMPVGTLGSLAAGEYAYGDNDTLGYSTIYVRLSDNVDPDTKADGYLEASSPFELATPYLEADLFDINYTQSADTLYVVHPSYAPRKITRTGHDAWTIATITFAASTEKPTTFARSAGSGSGSTYAVTSVDENGLESELSSTAAGGAGDTFGWDDMSVDHYNFYEDFNGNGIFYWLGTAQSNSFTVPAATDPDTDKSVPQARNPFSGSGNYPGVVTFHDQRLVFARTNNNPQTIYGSVIGDFENQNRSTPLRDDDAYTYTINALQVNEIKWLVPLDDLIIGTTASEWRMSAGTTSDAITPTSVNMNMQSRWGSAGVQPIMIGNTILFIQRAGSVVRDYTFEFTVDSYTGNNLAILANHLFDNHSIVDWAYQQHPDSIVWAVRDDGVLLGLTYARDHEVWGWHRHDTSGLFESIASVPNSAGEDEVYVVVQRNVNGSDVRYIEVFQERIEDDDVELAWFVDSALRLNNPLTITGATQASPVVISSTAHGLSNGDEVDIRDVAGMTELNGNRYKVANAAANTFELTSTEDDSDIDGTAFTAYTEGGSAYEVVTSISGLEHLEGKTVKILANGSVLPEQTVSSGAVALTHGASIVTIGLGYTQDLETMEIELATANGTLQDKKRHVPSVVLRLENTRSLQIGPSTTDRDRLDEVQFRDDENYGDPIALFTGDREVYINFGQPLESRVFIRNEEPVPVTVLAIMPRVVHEQRSP